MKVEDGRCPPGYDYVKPFRRKDGSYVHGFCKKRSMEDIGTDKEEALKRAKGIREKGIPARVEELHGGQAYGTYMGIPPEDVKKVENIVEKDGQHENRKKLSYKDAVEKMEPVEVNMRLHGEPAKGKVYLAVIKGTDPKFGLKREFLNGDRTYTDKGRIVTIDYNAKLKPGTILEAGEGGSWKNTYGSYYIVTPSGVKKLQDNYNGNGRLYIKDLMKKREKYLKDGG